MYYISSNKIIKKDFNVLNKNLLICLVYFQQEFQNLKIWW